MAFSLVRLLAAFRGTGNAPTDVSAANPLPVTVSGTVAANAGTNLNTSALALEAGNLAAIKTAIEILDNFISGARGLVTEDNSAAIKAAVELLDNAISGNEMRVNPVSLSSPSSKGITTPTGTAAAVTGTPVGSHEMVIAAHPDNTGLIYVGTRSDITTKSTVATMGIALAAGMSHRKYVPAGTTWYTLGDTSGQLAALDWGGGA